MERQLFSSRFTAILTMLGVSMGLGNVWRFPYMMGSYGGSAFLFVYLAITLLLGIPALMAEMALGRESGGGTVNALRLSLGNRLGGFFGYFLLVVVTVAASYYAVIVGNVFYTALFSLVVGFRPESLAAYRGWLANGWLQYGVTMALVAACLWVLHQGLTRGIELLCKVIVPFFFLVLVYVIIEALLLPGAIARFKEFLQPDWALLHPTEIFAAMGQAFFSVGLGGTFVVVYAGFFKKDESIAAMAMYTGLGDAGSSLLVGLFLIPSILVFGLNMAAGPTLIFDTFPHLFGSMPGGRWVGSLFLLSVFIVVFPSLVAAYQVPYTSVQHEWPSLSKNKLLISIGLIQAVLTLPSSLYPGIISTLDLIFGSVMQVTGSALCVLGLTWGISRPRAIRQMFLTEHPTRMQSLVYWWIKWVIPLALVAVLLGYVFDLAR